MALNIPNVGNNLDALMNGIKTGSNFYTGIMNPILKREHEKQLAEQFGITDKRQAEQFAQNMALKQQQESRMAQLQGLQMQQLRNKLDPNYEFNQFKALQDKIMGAGQSGAVQQPQQPAPNQEMGEGMGMFSPQGMQEAQQAPQQSTQVQGGTFDALKQNPMLRGFFKHKFGFDPLAAVPQSPQEKLQDKMKLEDYKHEQAIEQKRLENDLKDEHTAKIRVDAAKNDIPHLQQTLDALEKMKKIATNNPDLFGHSGIGGFGAEGSADRFAKTTTNPNAGAWQTYGLGPIVAAESKMSSRGNQLALKQALTNKPNFSEHQNVAISKIDANIGQIKKQIEENKKLASEDVGSSKVTVIDPNGKRFTTTAANAQHLPKGWKNG